MQCYATSPSDCRQVPPVHRATSATRVGMTSYVSCLHVPPDTLPARQVAAAGRPSPPPRPAHPQCTSTLSLSILSDPSFHSDCATWHSPPCVPPYSAPTRSGSGNGVRSETTPHLPPPPSPTCLLSTRVEQQVCDVGYTWEAWGGTAAPQLWQYQLCDQTPMDDEGEENQLEGGRGTSMVTYPHILSYGHTTITPSPLCAHPPSLSQSPR